jgi:hypothetical protein
MNEPVTSAWHEKVVVVVVEVVLVVVVVAAAAVVKWLGVPWQNLTIPR